jgi:hypothetical protein
MRRAVILIYMMFWWNIDLIKSIGSRQIVRKPITQTLASLRVSG